ncbi:RICIN domain-containing protein [Embleya sp. AB8]|uniref:RICIN domain-containing protein n=1 Tax=Embleya sp. AB8 TaxID=3156304 RepID=UPI003C74FE1A
MSLGKKIATTIGVFGVAMAAVATGTGSASAGVLPDGQFRLQRVLPAGHTPLCLGTEGGHEDDGTRVIQWPCNGNADQKWYTELDAYGGRRIVNAKSHTCLDVPNGDPGAGLIIYFCHSTYNQQWSPMYADNGAVRINSGVQSMALDMPGDSEEWGYQVKLYGPKNVPNQMWLTPAA